MLEAAIMKEDLTSAENRKRLTSIKVIEIRNAYSSRSNSIIMPMRRYSLIFYNRFYLLLFIVWFIYFFYFIYLLIYFCILLVSSSTRIFSYLRDSVLLYYLSTYSDDNLLRMPKNKWS